MQDLVEYIIQPLVQHPDAVSVNQIDGDASILLELRLHPEDVAAVRGEDSSLLRAIQQVLSASGGDRKPVLDLIEGSQAAAEE